MQLIEQISEDTYDPTMFEDEEKKRILSAIDEKIAGKQIVANEPHEPASGGAQVIDLVEALRASLGKGGGLKEGRRRRTRRRERPSRSPRKRRGDGQGTQGRQARGEGRGSCGRRRARREPGSDEPGGAEPLHDPRASRRCWASRAASSSGLIASGFVAPSRGPRNEYRFTFREVVLLRTAVELQAARHPAAQDPRLAAQAQGDAAGRAAAHRLAHHRGRQRRHGARRRLAMARRHRPARDGLRGRACRRQRRLPAAHAGAGDAAAGRRGGVVQPRRGARGERPACRRSGVPARPRDRSDSCRRVPQPRRAAVREPPLRRGGRALRRSAEAESRTKRCSISTAPSRSRTAATRRRRSPATTRACASRPTSPTRTTTPPACTSSSATRGRRCATSTPTGDCSGRADDCLPIVANLYAGRGRP